MARYRVAFAVLAAVFVFAMIGGVFGRSVLATDDRLSQQYRIFTTALAAVEQNSIEKVEPDRLVYSAIGGMLQTLDPHSTFLDPATYKRMRERQEGHYYGLGITIVVIDGDITVSALFEGSPAYKKGIRRGDIIARIEGEDAKGWTTDDAVRRLRGPKGTSVKISLRRPGYDRLIDLEVPRDDINIPTIPAAFMADATTGYIRLQDFAENTDRDLSATLKDLSGKGMKRLILDIRGNPGGPLDQAIRVANEFLPQGAMIVSTHGRVQNSDSEYHATERSDYTKIPLVVLVNRNSASASEIVSGALQDHDRAVIVGETTFGKALVQSVYRISDGAGLALTTARYYTPSGRLIQRPWDGTFDEYLNYGLKDQNASRPHNAADLKYTDAKRPVYGGGGIEPDKRLEGPIEGFNPTKFGRLLYNRQVFASFAERFSAEGDTRIQIEGKPMTRALPRNFTVDDAMLQEFKKFLQAPPLRISVDEQAFQQDVEFIRAMLHFDIDVTLYTVSEARRNLFDKDPQAQYALSLFPEAERLLTLTSGRPASPTTPAAGTGK
jgi:carboxyl-terminal processing protease